MPIAFLANFDDFIYGPDNEKPMYGLLEEVLQQAKEDGVRLQIDVRLKTDGIPNSRNEHQFAVDPDVTSPDAIMSVILKRLQESPGETFSGQIRLNFGQAGSGGNRYRSYTRNVRYNQPTNSPDFSTGLSRSHFGRGLRRPTSSIDLDDDNEGEETEGIDNAADLLNDQYTSPSNAYPSQEEQNYGSISQEDLLQAALAMQNGGSSPVTHEQFSLWMETTMGLTFRSLAQQMTMFERVIGFMDSVTTRYGLPHPEEPGIIEARGPRGNTPTGGMPGGLGFLPTLLNAAAKLATAKDPGELAENAVDLAQGNVPPPGAARQAAIQGAAALVRQLPRGEHRAPTPSFAPRDPNLGPSPDSPDHNGSFFDDDGYPPEPEPEPNFDSNELYNTSPSGPPDLRGLRPDEVKDAFVQWIRDNPDNKSAVMEMLPELSQEIM